MVVINGYIDGNTVVAVDDGLRNFNGSEILVRLVKKPEAQTVAQSATPEKNERLKACKRFKAC